MFRLRSMDFFSRYELNTPKAQFVAACVVRNKLEILTAFAFKHTKTTNTYNTTLCDSSQINEFMRCHFVMRDARCDRKHTCVRNRWNSIYGKSLSKIATYFVFGISHAVFQLTCAHRHHIYRKILFHSFFVNRNNYIGCRMFGVWRILNILVIKKYKLLWCALRAIAICTFQEI